MVPDVEVGRFALRTFALYKNRLRSVTVLSHFWEGGVCEARCYAGSTMHRIAPPRHPAPDEECKCGIYGTLSLQALRSQYVDARKSVAVFAAEGKTIIGDTGLRTAAARIVAYWHAPDWQLQGIYERHAPGAARFDRASEMAEAYGLDGACEHSRMTMLGNADDNDRYLAYVLEVCNWCGAQLGSRTERYVYPVDYLPPPEEVRRTARGLGILVEEPA